MIFATGLTLVIWGIGLSLTVYSTYLTVAHFKNTKNRSPLIFIPFPITILKPLKGVDEGIEVNLEGFFQLEYPEYELIFSVSDPKDPAVQVVELLMRKYPQVPAKLILGEIEAGPNPKVRNLVRGYHQAKYDWILISDSNVRVKPNYLRHLASQFRPGVGLITSVISGQHPLGLGGHLEAMFLNTFYARGMILAFKVGRPCVMGKSMLFQRSVANRFGGIAVLAKYLAEDYMAGEAMKLLGFRIIPSFEPIVQHIGRHSIHQFWTRHLRWGRIRKSQVPLTFFLEPIFGCILSGIIGSIGFHYYLGIHPLLFLLAHIATWSLCDLLVAKGLGSRVFFSFLPIWIIRELLSLPLWLCIASGNTVEWRGKRLSLDQGGILQVGSDSRN